MKECPDHLPLSEELALLDRIARATARRRRLHPNDVQDFAQSVQLRVIERNYELFRQFAGHSSLETYLHVVVGRLLLDWLNSRYGKWRPCTAARALGGTAVTLDRLINRDGYTIDEAIHALAHQGETSERDLRALAAVLPRRAKRRFIANDEIESAISVSFDDPIEASQRELRSRQAKRALRNAVSRLPREERRLLAMRYIQRRSVQEIAGSSGADAKALYRRFDRMLRTLRHALASDGITASSSVA